MEYKIGEIVTLPPYDTKAEVVEVSNDGCEGCYYSNKTSLCYEYMNNGVLGGMLEKKQIRQENYYL